MTDHNANHAPTPEEAKPTRFELGDIAAMVIAAWQVLWAPILLLSSGWVIVYLLAWLWMRVL